MRANAVLALVCAFGACQSPKSPNLPKLYSVALTFVSDCPLSVRSSGAWLNLTQNLPSDSFDTWLFIGESDRPLSTSMKTSAQHLVRNIDSARILGFTHYPMVQIWKGSPMNGQLLYRGPIDNSATATGVARVKPDSLFVQNFLTRLRKGEKPTFEEHTVYGCYIEP
ncbi:MAG: hypothetical protein RL577_17 [Bacteroidota bacterium]|jgi:hypothetical protein